MSEPFIPAVLDEADLDPYAFRIYCRIRRRWNPERGCDESIPNMADGCGISLKRARRALLTLEERGMVRRTSRPGQSPRFDVTPCHTWITPSKNDPPSKCATPSKNDPPPLAKATGVPLAKTTPKGTPSSVSPKAIPSPPTPSPEKIDLPPWFDPDLWAEWEQHRREIGKRLKPTTVKHQLRQLTKFSDHGHDPNDIIRTSLANGWTGLFEPKPERGGPSQRERAAAAKQDPAAAHDRISRAVDLALGIGPGSVGGPRNP